MSTVQSLLASECRVQCVFVRVLGFCPCESPRRLWSLLPRTARSRSRARGNGSRRSRPRGGLVHRPTVEAYHRATCEGLGPRRKIPEKAAGNPTFSAPQRAGGRSPENSPSKSNPRLGGSALALPRGERESFSEFSSAEIPRTQRLWAIHNTAAYLRGDIFFLAHSLLSPHLQ